MKARGFREVLGLGLARAREAIGSSNALIMQVRSSGGEVSSLQGLRFRPATAADGERYARDIGTDTPGSFRARLSETTHCYLVVWGDRLVHSSWVTTTGAWTREIGRDVRPPTGDAYIYESFTRPEMRGRGVYPFALKAICAALGEAGIERVWVAAEADNVASQKAMAKAGFEPAFTLPYARRLGRLWLGDPEGPDPSAARSFSVVDA